MKESLIKIVISAFSFVLVYNLLFFKVEWGVAVGLLFLFLNIYFFLTKSRENKNLLIAVFCSALSILFAFLYSVRANEVVRFFDVLAALFLSSTALYFYKQPQKISLEVFSILMVPLKLAISVAASVFNYSQDNKWSKDQMKSSSFSAVLRGFIITVPIFLILLFLLMQGDPVFEKLASSLFKDIGERAVVSVIIFIFLLSLGITKIIETIIKKDTEQKEEKGKALELGIILISIISLFTIFIFVQFRYLFSGVGERELAKIGIASLTYSEYVRRGFFELILASLVSSVVVLYILNFLRSLPKKQKKYIQIFSVILTLEAGLLLLSSLQRLFLYANTHGLTRARIFGFVFLVWLAILIAVLLIRVIRELKPAQISAVFSSITILVLLSLNVFNIDGLVATKYKPTINKEIDYDYITSLSPDAYGSWRDALEKSEKTIISLEKSKKISSEDYRQLFWARSTLGQLANRTGDLVDKYGSFEQIIAWHKNAMDGWEEKLKGKTNEESLPDYFKQKRGWQVMNFGELSAFRSIDQSWKDWEKLKDLRERADKLESKVSENVRQTTIFDRTKDAPLTR